MDDERWTIEEGEEASGYQRLEVWRLARDLSVDIHRMTLEQLPRFELHEVGSQVRRSAKSIRANIVEGYGKRRYKLEFLRHLTYALGSAQETLEHLDTLHETGALTSQENKHPAGRPQEQHRVIEIPLPPEHLLHLSGKSSHW